MSQPSAIATNTLRPARPSTCVALTMCPLQCPPLALHTPAGLQAAAAFGGLSKFDQVKELKAGCEVAICTPGRMIDLIKMKACTLARVTYLVLDEADRMLDMGFEPQVRHTPQLIPAVGCWW